MSASKVHKKIEANKYPPISPVQPAQKPKAQYLGRGRSQFAKKYAMTQKDIKQGPLQQNQEYVDEKPVFNADLFSLMQSRESLINSNNHGSFRRLNSPSNLQLNSFANHPKTGASSNTRFIPANLPTSVSPRPMTSSF